MRKVWGWLVDFGQFWYDFVVGDDWTIAAGVVVALGATYGLLKGSDVAVWWLPPIAAVAICGFAVYRANRREESS